MSKDKKLSDMTETELRNLIKEVITEMNNFRDMGKPFYFPSFPSYIGDGLPPELGTDRTYATDHTEMRKQ